LSRDFKLGLITGIVTFVAAITVLTWPLVPALIAMALGG
jgi:hypothetical protein